MNPSLSVAGEGNIARPRPTPFSGVPFGSEWTFRGARDARSGSSCLAGTITTCIDVLAPHRCCSWTPPDAARLAPLLPAVVPAETRASVTRPRRAMFAAGWSVGAIGIIGWLVATHERAPNADVSLSTVSGLIVAPHAAQPQITTRGDADRADSRSPATRQAAIRQPAAPQTLPLSVVADGASSSVTPTALRAPRAERLAAAQPPHEKPRPELSAAATARSTRVTRGHPAALVRHAAASVIQRAGTRIARQPDLARTTQPRPVSVASRAPIDTPDDPRTLIALANALRAGQPVATHAVLPAASGFDWTAKLSHRRLTDSPDAFTH
jgi:hypothetical protein